MKAYLCFIVLITTALCASTKANKKADPNFKNEVRGKIIECISSAEGISQVLKEHIEKIKSSDERIPLHFSKVELNDKDREVVRTCKIETFKELRKKRQEATHSSV